MKKVLLLAAAMFAFAGCEKENAPEETPTSLSLSLDSKTFEGKPGEIEGGTVTVKVSSPSDWTLETKDGAVYDWVNPSATEGKNGDEVIFTVDPEDKNMDYHADYVFTCGKETAPFTIDFKVIRENTLEVLSGTDVLVGYAENKEVLVTVKSNYEVSKENVVVSGDGSEWLVVRTVFADEENEGNYLVYLSAALNETEAARQAVVTITAGDAMPVTLNVTQKPESKIVVEETDLLVDPAGGKLEIPVTANVEYDVVFESDWITHNGNAGGKETFTLTATSEIRSVTINFVEKDPGLGVEAVKVPVTVTQKVELISVVADFTNHDDTNKGVRAYCSNWTTPLEDMSQYTVEALVKLTGDYPNGAVAGVLGVGNRFRITMGEDYKSGQLKVHYGIGEDTANASISDESAVLEKEKWTHIAFVSDGENVTLYMNGEPKLNAKGVISPLTFNAEKIGEAWDNNDGTSLEELDPASKGFWIGTTAPLYAYNAFKGLVSEVRVWNKALTAEDIKSAGHYYNVATDAAGLQAYWKFNEGEGYIVRDHTGKSNDMVCEALIGELGWDSWDEEFICEKEDKITWVSVSLPE